MDFPKNLKNGWLVVLIAVLVCSCNSPNMPKPVEQAYTSLSKPLDFNRDVKPILSDKCYICHGPDKEKVAANLQLHVPELAYAELVDSPGRYALVPGKPGKSEVIDRILTLDPERIMPKPDSHLSLTDYEKAVLFKWVEDGAEYQDHWAFIPPKWPSLPEDFQNKNRYNPIDYFVGKHLKSERLDFLEETDKETLLRRVSFDLTGLPPSMEEIRSFVNDNSNNAYEKQVDRLLASPHYGEQMALDWMDVSRYADTHGYTVDRYRDVSPWRDWVIASFNANRPYDEFIHWQLAGDLFPDPSKEQILATTFNRLHPQNAEGGIIDEEFKAEYVADRANVLGEAFMGLTVSCAKCHDHKYDPISQKNYFELFSFFNNVNESGQISFDWSMPPPSLMLPTQEQEQFLEYMQGLLEEREIVLQRTKKEENKRAEAWISSDAYQSLGTSKTPKGLVSQVDFNSNALKDRIATRRILKMQRQFSKKEKPVFSKGFEGYGLKMDGDTWLDMGGTGIFQRHEPFSIGIRLFIPESLEDGVIFHKGIGAKLYNFKGYHLTLEENRLELVMAHLHPGNAIIEETLQEIPKNQWLQLTLTYDGSSNSSGLRIFKDGQELGTKVFVDNLYKDIVFNNKAYGLQDVPKDPGLQIGARWRGKGIGGAVVDDILVFNRELTPLEILQISRPGRFNEIISKSSGQLTTLESNLLKNYFVANLSDKVKSQRNALQKLKKPLIDSMDRVQEIMVMEEMPVPRETYLLERGQYDVPGAQVFPSTPESIFPYPESLPRNRLGLAKWLTHKEHPLTSRVTVNRYWQHFFGTGIVATTEDFGNQGELPSHPELLDWLALQFMESGWNVKELHKLMVMSRTYRQSSKAPKSLLKMDKKNRLLARGPSKRLSGEMLRNNVLAASGLLNRKIGGESVRPYQPVGLWKINGASYEEGKGEDLYRKSMYTIWKRSVPHPTIATFDAPDRSFCTVRRQETNTPLQALVLLNDPIYIEAAQVLGSQMAINPDKKQAISDTFIKLTGRSIHKKELETLLELYQEEYSSFRSNPKKMSGWLNTSNLKDIGNLDSSMAAAFAVVASTIINSDASIMKR